MIAPGLTSRQAAVLELVYSHVEDHGYPPSPWWIGTRLGTLDLQQVATHAVGTSDAEMRADLPDGRRVAVPRGKGLQECQHGGLALGEGLS